MSKQKLRVLQVGCGPRAQSHLAGMMTSRAVEIVGICDIDAKRLGDTANTFNIQKRFADMRTAIQQTQPELVNIVTPPMLRTSIIEPALAAGAPALLIEKPIALTPSESRHLVALGRDRLIAVNTQYQWMPHWQKFWQLLEQRALGEVRLLRASTGVNILEQGPHVLDLVLKAARLSGLPNPEWVLASCDGVEHFGKTPVPKDTSATIGLGQARLHFNAGPSAPPVPNETVIWYQQQIEIVGDKGRLWVSLNQGWKLWLNGKFTQGKTGWPRTDQLAQPALYKQLRQDLHHNTWQTFPTRVAVAAQNAEVMFACYASALRKQKVMLGEIFSDDVVAGLK